MSVPESPNSAAPGPRRAESPEDVGIRRVHERLDQLARSVSELNGHGEVASQSPEELRSGAEVAAKLAETQAELDGLRLAMRNRAVIEQAKGMLMLRLQVDEPQAFEYLRTMSNVKNRKLVDVAGDVVRTRAGEVARR